MSLPSSSKARVLASVRTLALAALLLPAFLHATDVRALAQARKGQAAAPYRLAAKDVVRIQVEGRPDLSGQFTVGMDGSILLPMLGSVKIGGKTTAEVSSDLSRRISLIQRESPQVNVTLVESPSQKVFVLGQVMFPGAYTLGEGASLWDAVAEAGGPQYEADLTAVEVVPADSSGGRTAQVVDLAAAIRDGRIEALVHPKPGDTIRIPSHGGTGRYGAPSPGAAAPVTGTIYIFGAVKLQGSQPLEQSPDLVRALIRSEPVDDANLSKVQLVRLTGPSVMRFNLDVRNEYLGKAELDGNPPLQPGDTIYIPHSKKFGALGMIGVVGSLLGIASSIALLVH